MSIVDYIISIKNEAERICISLNTSERPIEIYKHYCQKLEMLEDEGDKILVLSTPTIYLGIPEKEINEVETFAMNKYNLFHQDESYKKSDDLYDKNHEEMDKY